MILLSTDWHLEDQPDNEYRWEVIDIVHEIIDAGDVTAFWHGGDLCDKKDRHSGALINRVVKEISRIAQKVPVYVLKGNHDQPLTGPAYWQFLNELEHVSFADEPAMGPHGCLFLPHTRNPKKDWLPKLALYVPHTKAILMHQTVKGAKDGAHALDGQPLPDLPDVPIYSGDVHTQQNVNGIEYVGAPHPVRYGDSYPCRMLLLDEHTFRVAKAIKLNPIQKSVVDIASVEELTKFNLSKGDHIRIRFRLPAAELKSWPNIEQAIEKLTAKQGIEVASVEPIMTLGPKAETYNIWGSPEKVMEMFAAAEGIEGDLLQVGLDLLK